MDIQTLKTLSRRYWLAFYWLAFACFTSVAAEHPGLVVGPEIVPYPWPGVLFTWSILAAYTAVLYVIFRSSICSVRIARVGCALVFATGLLVYSFFTFGTDMPGFVYVPMYFSVFTFIGLVAYAVFLAGLWSWKYYRNAL